ncbi:MAG: hypothetical protein IKH86_05620 [Prevotella sp.]|nr:hypothetical protein [Prevotella sp.]
MNEDLRSAPLKNQEKPRKTKKNQEKLIKTEELQIKTCFSLLAYVFLGF